MNGRARLGRLLRTWADRIDHEHAPRLLSTSFTFEKGRGQVFRDDGKGCRLAYLDGAANYERAHTEADRPGVWVDWATGTLRRGA